MSWDNFWGNCCNICYNNCDMAFFWFVFILDVIFVTIFTRAVCGFLYHKYHCSDVVIIISILVLALFSLLIFFSFR